MPRGAAGLQVLALASAQQHLVNLQLVISQQLRPLEQHSPGAGGVPKARHWHPTRRAGVSQSPGVRRLRPRLRLTQKEPVQKITHVRGKNCPNSSFQVTAKWLHGPPALLHRRKPTFRKSIVETQQLNLSTMQTVGLEGLS